MTNADLADRVEEWLHGRELQYATIKLMADVIYALRRSQPEGDYVMVPREPTEAMHDAGIARWANWDAGPNEIYRAMLQAAEAEGRKP